MSPCPPPGPWPGSPSTRRVPSRCCACCTAAGKVRLLLSRVEREEAPDFVMGAMCYSPVALPERVEYVCPVCGERTFYGQYEGSFVQWELPAMRRMVEEMEGNGFFELLLEETFCGHCTAGDPTGEARLLVVYAEGDTVRTPVCLNDLQMLEGLVRGELSYTQSNDSQSPLRSSLDRLRTILGMEEL
ncbi:MAG: hypothetical protein R6V62_10610 [Candidatus Fermentibacteraceae bacterium]